VLAVVAIAFARIVAALLTIAGRKTATAVQIPQLTGFAHGISGIDISYFVGINQAVVADFRVAFVGYGGESGKKIIPRLTVY
jgi:hypothetical protein